VLVGLSLGGCVARLYAAEYPSEISGMVIVDHAFQPDPPAGLPRKAAPRPEPAPEYDTPPVLIHQEPIVFSVEESSHFERLPERAQQLHRWAESLHPKLPTWQDAEDCLAQLKAAAPGAFPLGNLPLVVVSTGNQSRGYSRLQSELMAQSRQSSQMIAEGSFHAVEIDRPDVVAGAVRKVVDTVREAARR
jgi:pimeloyl-ACP methyl ester carboxylesterase